MTLIVQISKAADKTVREQVELEVRDEIAAWNNPAIGKR